VKLRYFVTVLALVKLQGSVCTQVRWGGQFQCTLFGIHCCIYLPNLMEICFVTSLI